MTNDELQMKRITHQSLHASTLRSWLPFIRHSSFVVSVLFSLFLFSCGPGSDRVRLKGSFKRLHNAEIYAFSSLGGWSGYDTLHIESGDFSFDKDLSEPTVVVIQYPNFTQLDVIAEPGKTVKIEGDANNLSTTKVSGSDENELLTDFRLSLIGKSDADVKRLAADFIRKNPSTLAAIAVINRYFVTRKDIDGKLMRELFGILLKTQPKNTLLQMLYTQVEPLTRNAAGCDLPAFSATALDGSTVSSAQFRGSYLLINFMGSWNPKSQSMKYKVKQLAHTYPSLKMMNISLDSDIKSWKQSVKTDSLPGKEICDGLMWSSPIVQTLGVRYVPGNLLVDAKGVIIARDLSESELDTRLSQLLKH